MSSLSLLNEAEARVTASAFSQHLRVLQDLGLVPVERRGHRLRYFLDSERLAAYQDLVREHPGDDFVAREREQTVKG